MFYEDYSQKVSCSHGIKSFVKANPSCEASAVLLLALYESGAFGEGNASAATYTLDGRPVTIRSLESGKLYMSFAEENA